MDAIARYACSFLSSMFEERVEPVAGAYDFMPEVLEDGRSNAVERAADIRAGLAQIHSDRGGVRKEDIYASYIAAKSLLADLWSIAMEDARGAPEWASSTVSRAITRGAVIRC